MLSGASEQLELAEGRWEEAIREHAAPPPDAGLLLAACVRWLTPRLRRQAAYAYAAEQGLGGDRGRRGCRRASFDQRAWRETRWRQSRRGSASTRRSSGCRRPALESAWLRSRRRSVAWPRRRGSWPTQSMLTGSPPMLGRRERGRARWGALAVREPVRVPPASPRTGLRTGLSRRPPRPRGLFAFCGCLFVAADHPPST